MGSIWLVGLSGPPTGRLFCLPMEGNVTPRGGPACPGLARFFFRYASQRCRVSQSGAIQTGASLGASGSRPRIRSEAFSASMIVGALRLPETMLGMTEASTTRKRLDAVDPALGVDHRHRVALRAHLATAGRVIGAFGMGADEGVDFGVALHVRPGRKLGAPVRIEGFLGKDLAGQADRGAHLHPIAFGCHVVEDDRGRLARVRGPQPQPAGRGRSHRPDVGLEAVARIGIAAVIIDRDRQEMILQVWVLDARRRADEAAGLELVRGADAAPQEQPVGADPKLISRVSPSRRARSAGCTRAGRRSRGGPEGFLRRPCGQRAP